ncbi:MAG: DUF131 domain-containing protein [Methanobacteriota archaeon]|nr:MAG: DUF131 domain-containing protein [Euryarchaeota archaeon]
MNPRIVIPIALFVTGATAVAAAVATGEAEASLFLVFPVFSGSSGLFLLGVGLVVASILAGFAAMIGGVGAPEGQFRGSTETADGRRATRERPRVGGVVLIGPIPIAYGSDARMAVAALALAAVAVVVVILLLLLL